MTIEELFGTLQMSVVAGWRKHLKSAKYGKHIALQEFYEEMPDKVDALIEGWMGAHGKKVGSFQNVLTSSNMNTLKYLQELKKICKEGYDLLDDNEELEGLMDDIVNLINSTLYKVKELSESSMTDLSNFINEQLNDENSINEARLESYTVKYGDERTYFRDGLQIPVMCDKKDIETIVIAIYYGHTKGRGGWCGYYTPDGSFITLIDCM